MSNGLLAGVDDDPRKKRPQNPLLKGLEPQGPVAASASTNPLMKGVTVGPPAPVQSRFHVEPWWVRTGIGAAGLIAHQIHSAGSAIWFAMTHPVRKEGHGDSYAAQLAASQKMFDDLQNMPPDEAKRVQEGSALVMSFGLGGAGETLLAKTGLGRAGAFLASEFAGGAIYGSVRPLEEDESRASAVLGDAASFAAFGGVLRGTGWALRRYISVMPRARRIAALRELSRRLDAIDSKLAEGGVNMSQLPPDAAESLIEPELRAS